MDKEQRRGLILILIGAVLFLAVCLAPLSGLVRIAAFLAVYLFIGYEVLFDAAANLLKGHMLDENFLMTIASVGAFCIGNYPEAVFVMLFFRVGEWFEHYAVGKSRRSIADLMDIYPEYANIETEEGLVQVAPDEVLPGTIIVVRPGERVPIDGVVAEGSSSLNTASLTGEAVPREVFPGSEVISGCVNLNGMIKVKTSREFSESTVARVLELVENSSMNKAQTENFITKFARYYTPVVVGCALLLAVVPSLIVGNFSEWLHRALIFLVISCPCALVISVPLSYFAGIGCASKKGILVKGSNFLEALAHAAVTVFDKTGTLTEGKFQVTGVYPEKGDEQTFLRLAAAVESYSTHPIALSVREAAAGELIKADNAEEISGRGIRAEIDGKAYYAGNSRLLSEQGIAVCPPKKEGTVIYLAAEGEYLGQLIISDKVKPDAEETVRSLKKEGVRLALMLTGDHSAAAQTVAEEVGLDGFYGELLPEGKVEKVRALLKEKDKKETLLFVGDGVNDAPVLVLSDVGIAMGALGSDAAIEAADIVLMDDSLSKITLALKIAKKTRKIVIQNIVFALGVKLLVLALGAFGEASMLAAAFADVGVSVIAILNATRAMQINENR